RGKRRGDRRWRSSIPSIIPEKRLRRPGFPRRVDCDRIPARFSLRIRETATTRPSDTEILEPTDNHHPDVLAVRQYWEERRRGRLMPARAEIDPLDLRPFLP